MHCSIPNDAARGVIANRPAATGFTITELLVASSILVMAVSVSLAGYLHMLREMHVSDVQSQLDVDIQSSVERIKHDVRLSSLGRMFFYPEGPGPYTAMSFPMARDDDHDGVIDKDADDQIVWNRTIVYHVWEGAPYQLRRTVFEPRVDMTDSERQEQLSAVAASGEGTGTHNGANATTAVMFENLFVWELSPRGAIYDGYAPSRMRDVGVGLGSCILGPGAHTLTFTSKGKNAASSGFHIGIDSVTASPSGSVREGEDLFPPINQLGVQSEQEYMPGGSWGGNYQLLFPAVAAGQYVAVEIDNDLWKETNFSTPGDTLYRTEIDFDDSQDPADFVLALQGHATNWTAQAQTSAAGTSTWANAGAAVRVVLRGEEMEAGNWIGFDESRSRLRFDAGTGSPVAISGGYVGKLASSFSNTMDVAAGTQQAILFSGSASASIPADGSIWSDTIDIDIHKTNSYAVSYLVDDQPAQAALRRWQDTLNPGVPGTFFLPSTASPNAGDSPWRKRSAPVVLQAPDDATARRDVAAWGRTGRNEGLA